MRRRRSVLACPGGNPRMVAKAATLEADEVVLDLEDAVGWEQKSSARLELIRSVEALDFGRRLLAVRVNRVGSAEGLRDLLELVPRIGSRLHSVVVPKVSTVAEVGFVDHCLGALEAEAGIARRLALEIQIEDPVGLEAVFSLAGASPRIECLIFGPGDFAAAMGMPQLAIGAQDAEYPGDLWHYPLFRIAGAARAHGLQAIDGPCSLISDLEGLRRASRRAAALGLDGKWVIHPDQVGPVNLAFTPSEAEIERAAALIRRLDTQGGASRLGEEMVDGASRKMAEGILARAQTQGE